MLGECMGGPHVGERQCMGEQHCGERLDMDVLAGPRTKHGTRSEAALAGPQRSRERSVSGKNGPARRRKLRRSTPLWRSGGRTCSGLRQRTPDTLYHQWQSSRARHARCMFYDGSRVHLKGAVLFAVIETAPSSMTPRSPRRGTRAAVCLQSHDVPQFRSLLCNSEDAERDWRQASNKRNPTAGQRICASIHQLPGWTSQSAWLTILLIVRTGQTNGIRNNYQ